jgi:hypothetical protein
MKTHRSVHAVLCLAIAGAGARSDAQEPRTETRSYDLSAVAGEVRNAPFILWPSGSLVPVFRYGEQEDLFGDAEERAPLPNSEEAHGLDQAFGASRSVVLDRDTIQQRVVDALGSAGIEPADDQVSWSGNVLTVRAPPAALAAVEASLAPVLAAASPLVSVDCILIPLEVLDGLTPEWRSDPGSFPREAFARALHDGRARLLSVAARSGQRAATGSRGIKAMVVDQEVNQTGVIPVVNPVIEGMRSGDRLEVRPVILSGRDAIWLDLVVGRARTGGERKDLGGDFGEIELPETRETLISTTLVARPGTPVVAGVIQDRQGLAALVRAEIRPGSRSLAGQPAGGRIWGFHDVRVLVESRPARRWPSWGVQERLSPSGPRFPDFDTLAELVRRKSGSREDEALLNMYTPHHLDFRGPEEPRNRVEAALAGEIAAVARVVSVDVDILTVSRAGLAKARETAEGGFILAAEWRKALGPKDVLAERRCAVTGVAGQVHALRQADVRSYVADVSNVSGGTGFAILMASDPEIQSFGDGLEMRLLAEPLPGGEAARVRLEGAWARTVEERPFTVTFPVIPYMTGTYADADAESPGRPSGKATATGMRKTLPITLPHQAIDYWSVEVEAPHDRDVILHVNAGEGDSASILIGRVRAIK